MKWSYLISSGAILIIHKFYCNCTKNKNYKIKSPLSLWYTNWSHLHKQSFRNTQTFTSFYGLKWRSKYESQRSKNLLVLYVSNFLFTIYLLFSKKAFKGCFICIKNCLTEIAPFPWGYFEYFLLAFLFQSHMTLGLTFSCIKVNVCVSA